MNLSIHLDSLRTMIIYHFRRSEDHFLRNRVCKSEYAFTKNLGSPIDLLSIFRNIVYFVQIIIIIITIAS